MKKYGIIKNLLSNQEVKLLSKYCKLTHINNHRSFDENQTGCGETYFYGDSLCESLSILKKQLIEKHSGYKLIPTYTFWRMYNFLSDLKKHRDRPSCEISCTIFIDSCSTPWPIFMDGKAVTLKPGDGVWYRGQEVEHWRETFKGDWHAQMFLHYVNANGPHKEWAYDKRSVMQEEYK